MTCSPIWFNARAIASALQLTNNKRLPLWTKYYMNNPLPSFNFIRPMTTTFFESSFYSNRLKNFDFNFYDIAVSEKNAIPDLCVAKLDWDDISCRRTQEIENICNTTQKPLTILYSGGIDSTYVVCCILKYSSKEMIKNTSILMSTDSFLENPYFTQNVVLKRFDKILNSRYMGQLDQHKDSITICGRFGDRIIGTETGLGWCILNRDKIKDHYSKHKDNIIDYMKKALLYEETAETFFEILDQSARASGLPIHTTYDLFWWLNFNFAWSSIIPNQEHAFSSVFWFDTEYFQQWSMQNVGSDLKFNLSTFEEKLAMKKFIYDVDKNEINLKFRIKECSILVNDKVNATDSMSLMIDENGSRFFTKKSQILADAEKFNLISNN